MTPNLSDGLVGPVMLPALQILQLPRPLVIAHRGDSAEAPENTLPAFERALCTGADLVELDYHHSSDGVPVVMHDETLDRTTDAAARWGRKHRRIDLTAVADLKLLDAGKWFGPRYETARVPLLKEALDVIQRGSATLIERKAGDAETCVRLLREAGLINHVVVQSFDWKFLHTLHALAPGLVLGALGPTAPAQHLNSATVAAVVALGAKIVVWSEGVAAQGITGAQARGLKVWIYTVDDPMKARALVALGADGIITNKPALIRQTLES